MLSGLLTTSHAYNCFIFFFALISNGLCLYSFRSDMTYKGSYYPETPQDLAYSFYKDSTITKYTARTIYQEGKVYFKDKTDQKKYQVIPIWEAPAYALLIGSLWKLTNSLSYYDVLILQMVFFALSCVLLYQALLLLSVNYLQALSMVCCVPLFLPLLFLNSNPVRDAFCFYGVVVVFYIMIAVFYKKVPLWQVISAGILIALCQWMRPTVFTAFLMATLFIMFYSFCFYRNFYIKKLFVLCVLWLCNGFFFLVPYAWYNKSLYGHYFAGQTGQLLLDSMGWTPPNRINPTCPDVFNGLYCDGCVTQYTINRFSLDTHIFSPGTVQLDDKMKEAFWEWFWQDPLFWFKGLAWRIKKLLLLDLTWSTTHGLNWQWYNSFSSYKDRIYAAYSLGWFALLEFLFRRWHVRIVMFLGYVGALLWYKKRDFFMLGLLFFLVGGGIAPAIISHPEHRYVTPFYFVFPLLMGYFLYWLVCYITYFIKTIFSRLFICS